MYLVAASENGKILPATLRIVDKPKHVLKHLRYISNNCWPIKYSLEKILDNDFYVVYNMKINQLSGEPKVVAKGSIKRWIQDEKFDKVQVDTLRSPKGKS